MYNVYTRADNGTVPHMYTYVSRRVLEPEVAARCERRALRDCLDDGWHWVDVPNQSLTSACGITVPFYSQWIRDFFGRELYMCSRCVAAMPAPGDTPLDSVPELLVTAQVADIMGVTRQAILNRAEFFGGKRLGERLWVFDSRVVYREAAERGIPLPANHETDHSE